MSLQTILGWSHQALLRETGLWPAEILKSKDLCGLESQHIFQLLFVGALRISFLATGGT